MPKADPLAALVPADHKELQEGMQDDFAAGVASGLNGTKAAERAGYSHPARAANRLKRNASLIERNADKFRQVGLDPLTPFFAVKDAMENAYRVETEFVVEPEIDEETGAIKRYTKRVITHQIPDHFVRLRAVQAFVDLMGINPTVAAKIQINVKNDNRTQTANFFNTPDALDLKGQALTDWMEKRREQLRNPQLYPEPDPDQDPDQDDLADVIEGEVSPEDGDGNA